MPLTETMYGPQGLKYVLSGLLRKTVSGGFGKQNNQVIIQVSYAVVKFSSFKTAFLKCRLGKKKRHTMYLPLSDEAL